MKDERMNKSLSTSSISTPKTEDILLIQKQFQNLSAKLDTVLSSQMDIFNKNLAHIDAYDKALKKALIIPTAGIAQKLVTLNIPLVSINTQISKIIQPTIAINKIMAEFSKPQRLLAQTLHKSVTTALSPITTINLASYISKSTSLQLSLATNIAIKKALLKSFESVDRGVQIHTSLINNSYSSDNQINLRFQRDTSTIKSEIQYQKLEIIDTRISLIDGRFENIETDISQMKKDYYSIRELLTAIENDPFRYFKVNSFNFIKEASLFVVNGTIKIRLESKTIQDYICQVLFSNVKNLGEEWFWDDILEEMVTKFLYEGKKELSWKSVQDAIAKINIKIASETTIKDAILTPRSEIVQLNPIYFHN